MQGKRLSLKPIVVAYRNLRAQIARMGRTGGARECRIDAEICFGGQDNERENVPLHLFIGGHRDSLPFTRATILSQLAFLKIYRREDILSKSWSGSLDHRHTRDGHDRDMDDLTARITNKLPECPRLEVLYNSV